MKLDLRQLVASMAPEPALDGKLKEAELLVELGLRAVDRTPSTFAKNGEDDRLLDMPDVADVLGAPEEHAHEMGRRNSLGARADRGHIRQVAPQEGPVPSTAWTTPHHRKW